MEELLNKLIDKGWKPFGIFDKLMIRGQERSRKVFGFGVLGEVKYSIRELTSRESGLWQFVCENGMVKTIGSEIEIKNLNEGYGVVRDTDYQYRGIVSYLKDESELEDFLLDNIKIEGKTD